MNLILIYTRKVTRKGSEERVRSAISAVALPALFNIRYQVPDKSVNIYTHTHTCIYI